MRAFSLELWSSQKAIKWGLIFVLLLYYQETSAQKSKNYKGDYTLQNGRTGYASFDYLKDREQGKIIDGDFYFTDDNFDSGSVSSFIKHEQSGKYKNNLKNGAWQYQTYWYELNVKSIENLDLQYNLAARQGTVKAFYQNDLPSGEWTYEEKKYYDKILKSTPANAKFLFENGILTKDIFLRDTENDSLEYKIIGKADDKGFFDGKWSFTYYENNIRITEKREYKNGFLIKISKKEQDVKDTLSDYFFYHTKRLLNLINSENYKGSCKIADSSNFGITYNPGYADTSNAYLIQTAGNRRLVQTLEKIFNQEPQLHYPDAEKKFIVHTARFEFEISQVEDSMRKVLHQKHHALLDSVTSIVENDRVLVNSQRNDSMVNYVSAMTELRTQLILNNAVIEKISAADWKYVFDWIYLPQHFSFLSKANVDSTISHHSPELLDSVELYYDSLWQQAKEAIAYIRIELKKIALSDTLNALDSKILDLKSRMDSLYRNDTLGLSFEQKELLHKTYKRFGKQELVAQMRKYGMEEDSKVKIEYAETIIQYLNRLLSVHQPLSEIYDAKEKVEEAYTETKLDPFTYNTDFITYKKKPLYDKVQKELVPDLLESLKKVENIQSFETLVTKIIRVEERMLELRKKNTKSLEDKIKKARDNESILKLLEINT